MLRYTIFVLSVLTVHPAVWAHDYWLQPTRFEMASGERAAVQLFVGDHFKSEAERPFQADMTVSLKLVSKESAYDLKPDAKDGQKPVCIIQPKSAGNQLIVMERDWSQIEIEADKFTQYLEHEGLKSIIEMRRQAGEQKLPGRERYRRYLKALVQVDGKTDETYARRLGHRLEIIPHANPSLIKPGETLRVAVLFDGAPLPEAMVTVYHRNGDNIKSLEETTNTKGEVAFKLGASGIGVIRLVHMQRTKDTKDVDWESFWAAYTFNR